MAELRFQFRGGKIKDNNKKIKLKLLIDINNKIINKQ